MMLEPKRLRINRETKEAWFKEFTDTLSPINSKIDEGIEIGNLYHIYTLFKGERKAYIDKYCYSQGNFSKKIYQLFKSFKIDDFLYSKDRIVLSKGAVIVKCTIDFSKFKKEDLEVFKQTVGDIDRFKYSPRSKFIYKFVKETYKINLSYKNLSSFINGGEMIEEYNKFCEPYRSPIIRQSAVHIRAFLTNYLGVPMYIKTKPKRGEESLTLGLIKKSK